MRTHLVWIATLLLSTSLLAQTTPQPATAPAKADVPVTRVVLFTSGVGYFEHNGQIRGDADVQLLFKTDQINDILKSMVVTSETANVRGITYASRDPLSRALSSFAINLDGQPTMADLLRQLRGSEVTVAAPEPMRGKIVSVETRTRQVLVGGTATVIVETYLNVLTEGGLKSINMETVQSIQLSDKKLQAELDKALELLATSRDTNQKPVTIRFASDKGGAVKIGYINEMPVWKTSYRLDVTGGKGRLQGWAIVENTSEQDWANVRLSLVSGRPISFVMDLYTPLYINRPVVVPELYSFLQPRVYAEGLGGWADGSALKRGPREESGKAAAEDSFDSEVAQSDRPARSFAAPRAGAKFDLARGAAAMAKAANAGELFAFHLDMPVDLPRRSSAMLPILNSSLKLEKVSIYNKAVLDKNPLNGALLTNDTKMALPAGPITIFDDSTYAGDAQIEALAPDQKRLISYAIDLRVTVDPSEKSSSSLIGGKIVRGVLSMTYKHLFSQTYRVKNSASVKRTMVIEHPFVNERKLIEPAESMEKTPQVYRFRTTVDAGKTADFTVKEEQTELQVMGILDLDLDAIVYYSRQDKVPAAVRDALAKAADMKRTLSQQQAQLADLKAQKQQIEAGQDRLRENINTVGKDSQLGQRYLKKLSEQEDQIETLDKQIAELSRKVQDQTRKLQDYLSTLSVE